MKKNKTFLATFAIVLVLLAALFWLLWRTHTDLGVSNAHVELAGRAAGDAGYCIAGAIMLFGWWRERQAPPVPTCTRAERLP